MKNLILSLIVAILVTFGCNQQDLENKLKAEEWFNLLGQAFLFSNINSDRVFIYDRFENQELEDTIIATYEFGSELYGYAIEDSVINSLKTRSNSDIILKLDTITKLRINFVSDTSTLSSDYLLISEPFKIGDHLFCFSLTKVGEGASDRDHWIYFFDANNDYLKLLSIYDLQKDVFYENSSINEAK